LRHRFMCLIASFFDHPLQFIKCLRTSQAVISGSSALQLLFSLETSTWKANDLDVYVANGQVTTLDDFLRSSGFTCANSSTFPTYSLGSIRTITSYFREDRKVDLIQSRTHSALSPIFEFHLSPLMNYVSADSFFSAYPSLTARRQAIINPMLFDHGNLGIGTLYALLKYRQRGFLLLSPAQYRLRDVHAGNYAHNCGRAITCSETPRSSHDRNCLCVRVPDLVNDTYEAQETFHQIRWRLGGQRCMR
ncbi:hypothetical protein L210DRAFT_3319189, partial [Boletus edulis BED1]